MRMLDTFKSMEELKKYGTVEFYAEQFADLIADIQHDQPEMSDNLIAGFKLAIQEWREYHVKQITELDRVIDTINV